ncbi:hypothetical protein AAFF_G00246520 [Aldrovandia affinis]|uniref:Interleukin 4/13A n=1 Tax=Aldrovandia affinis TaxID=143900 RepID=A0AAD7SU29_9TELE|nr:hypothetical protein AAFF_G00246520 [Aldrovandia affinis]
MKILFVFSVALVFVSGLPTKPERMRHLEDIVKILTRLEELPAKIRHTLTADVIDSHKCEAKDFCKAEKVLSKIDHEEFRGERGIGRFLNAYNKNFNTKCIVDTRNELELKVLLQRLRICVQKHYSQ